jgi:hypothetical protein
VVFLALSLTYADGFTGSCRAERHVGTAAS